MHGLGRARARPVCLGHSFLTCQVNQSRPAPGPLSRMERAPSSLSPLQEDQRGIFLVTRRWLLPLPSLCVCVCVSRKFTKFWPGVHISHPLSKSFHSSCSKWKPRGYNYIAFAWELAEGSGRVHLGTGERPRAWVSCCSFVAVAPLLLGALTPSLPSPQAPGCGLRGCLLPPASVLTGALEEKERPAGQGGPSCGGGAPRTGFV